jgi:hypothetical protein
MSTPASPSAFRRRSLVETETLDWVRGAVSRVGAAMTAGLVPGAAPVSVYAVDKSSQRTMAVRGSVDRAGSHFENTADKLWFVLFPLALLLAGTVGGVSLSKRRPVHLPRILQRRAAVLTPSYSWPTQRGGLPSHVVAHQPLRPAARRQLRHGRRHGVLPPGSDDAGQGTAAQRHGCIQLDARALPNPRWYVPV